MRRFSNSGLFRRLYRTTSVLTAFDGLFNTRSMLWLLLLLALELVLLLFDRAPFVGWLAFEAPPLFVISDELVFWFWWWWTPLLPVTAFEWIEPIACKLLWWACWCCCCCDWFWWLYGGGGVILLWEFCIWEIRCCIFRWNFGFLFGSILYLMICLIRTAWIRAGRRQWWRIHKSWYRWTHACILIWSELHVIALLQYLSILNFGTN